MTTKTPNREYCPRCAAPGYVRGERCGGCGHRSHGGLPVRHQAEPARPANNPAVTASCIGDALVALFNLFA